MTPDHDQPMNEQESLQLIQTMIATAKQGVLESGRGFLVWGWMLFVCALTSVAFIYFDYASPFLPWNVFLLICVIMAIYGIAKPRKLKKVKTYMNELMGNFVTGFYICVFIVIFSMNFSTVTANHAFAFLLMLYGLMMFFMGVSMKLRTMIVGAVITWLCCIGSLLLLKMIYVMSFTALAVLAGYLVPGYILRAAWKKQQQSEMV